MFDLFSVFLGYFNIVIMVLFFIIVIIIVGEEREKIKFLYIY